IAGDLGRILGTAAKADDDRDRRLADLLAYIAGLDFSDWQYLAQPVEDALLAEADTAARAGAGLAGAQEGAAEEARQDAGDYAHDRAAAMVGMKFVDGALVQNPDARWAITDATHAGLRSLVEEAVAEGWSGQQVQEAIEESYWLGPDRAMTIARTEVAAAQSAGTLAGWRRSGVVAATRWLLAPGHGRLDECDGNAAAGAVPLGKKFPSGDYHVPAHPNCECSQVAVLKEAQ